MLDRLSRTKRNLALAVLAAVVLWFGWSVRSVLNPLILGYLLAYILNPMVQNLERRGWGRRQAANLIFISFFVVASVLSVAVVQQGRGLVRDLASTDLMDRVRRNLPAWVGGVFSEDAGIAVVDVPADIAGQDSAEGGAPPADPPTARERAAQRLPEELPPTLREALVDSLRELWTQVRAEESSGMRELALRQAGTVWPYLRSFFGSLLALSTLVFLLPIYAYFLLFELDAVHEFVLRYVPKRERDRFERIAEQIGEVLSSFFRGRLLICVLKGAFLTLGLWVVGVPYFVFLGMGSGALSLAPFIGPLLGFLVAFLMVLVRDGFWLAVIETGVVFLLAELLEGYVFLPKVLGDSLGLHPVVILASVFVGGAALGMFGFLIAVPLVAALVILAREWVLPALADWADEEPRPAVEGPPPEDGQDEPE